MTNTASRRAARVVLSALGFLVGAAGSLVFVLAVLALVAPPVSAADGFGGCLLTSAPGSLFDPCADLDSSRFADLRVPLGPVGPGDDIARGA